MEKRERAACPECGASLEPDDVDYLPVTREYSAFVCGACDRIIGFG